MSKGSKLNRETIAPPAEVTELDSYEPDYDGICDNCGGSPTVLGIRRGRIVYASGMCGICTWGESACANPANW